MFDISVIVPAKNEALNIGQCIERIAKACPGAEILIMDSGLDNTKDIVEKLKYTIPNLHYHVNQPDRGKGDAINNGIKLSTKNILVQIDADLQFLPEEIILLLEPIWSDQADMTLGSRFFVHSKSKDATAPYLRKYGNHLVSFWTSLLYRQKITDALAGFKAWKRCVTDSFVLESYNFSYEVELFAKALRKGWRVKDVAVSTKPRLLGNSNVPVIRTGMRILRDSFKFRFCKINS